MMSWKPMVLVVTPTPNKAAMLFAWLTDAGVCPIVVGSYLEARRHLDSGDPALLVSEVRLGEYNGLHLALRAHGRGIPVLLLGHPDVVLEREAKDLGAEYLTGPLEPQRLLALVAPIAEAARQAPVFATTIATNVAFFSNPAVPAQPTDEGHYLTKIARVPPRFS